MENRESRVSTSFEVRAEDDAVTVEGYAAVFDEDTVIGGQWMERIAPGAFTNAIGRDDVTFLINHEGLPLARTQPTLISNAARAARLRCKQLWCMVMKPAHFANPTLWNAAAATLVKPIIIWQWAIKDPKSFTVGQL